MRPRKRRKICGCACCKSFKPQGIPANKLEKVFLASDELEALRLADVTGMGQIESASEMHISQSTFQRVLSSARKKMATALVEGKMIHLDQKD